MYTKTTKLFYVFRPFETAADPASQNFEHVCVSTFAMRGLAVHKSKTNATVVPLDAKKRPFSAALTGRKIIEFNAMKKRIHFFRAG